MMFSGRARQSIFGLALVGPLAAVVLYFYKSSSTMPPAALVLYAQVEQIAASAGGTVSKPSCTTYSKNGFFVECPLANAKGMQAREALSKLGWVQTDQRRALDGESTYAYASGGQCARVSESPDASRLWLAVGCMTPGAVNPSSTP